MSNFVVNGRNRCFEPGIRKDKISSLAQSPAFVAELLVLHSNVPGYATVACF
jgi:hypothetical protein